jgi:hypothetical protein
MFSLRTSGLLSLNPRRNISPTSKSGLVLSRRHLICLPNYYTFDSGAFSLDTMGLAGFSHDFGSLSGRKSDVSIAFDAIFAAQPGVADAVVFFLQIVFPLASNLHTRRQRAVDTLHEACGKLAKQVIEKARVEEKGERSIMGLMGMSCHVAAVIRLPRQTIS